ncbi:uncharacterized protein DEA37_0006015 [Paragonimus westermani]|uniref:Uncharacterized protein n=1 Tax=Paragonimus westermani TaxID=34504 RepID=A0A5J4NJT7_9TREM|nr:uncharacterized protein DEA37_0006015 [Paragonimus westermani]
MAFDILSKLALVFNLVDVITFVGVAFVSNRENFRKLLHFHLLSVSSCPRAYVHRVPVRFFFVHVDCSDHTQDLKCALSVARENAIFVRFEENIFSAHHVFHLSSNLSLLLSPIQMFSE